MFDNFDECLTALLNENKGGVIVKNENRFSCAVTGQPEPEGTLFMGIHESATRDIDGIDWRVMYYGGDEARAAYREFTLNPEHGQLVEA
jgi:hypothetical protein